MDGSSFVQDDGLPSVGALESFDDALKTAQAAKEVLIFNVDWRSVDEKEFYAAYQQFRNGLLALRDVRARFKVESVTTSKVVRA